MATPGEEVAGGSSSKAVYALDSWSSLVSSVARSPLFWMSSSVSASGEGSRFHVCVLERCARFCQMAPDPSSHCSHCRLKSFERWLFCLPLVPNGAQTSGGTAGLSRPVSSLEMTRERVVRRHRVQTSWAAVGKWYLRLIRVERTSLRSKVSGCLGCSLTLLTGLLKIGSHQ